jgi:DNA-binding LacI/PurR family transcriptional regulator
MFAKALEPLTGNRKRESAQTAIRSLARRIGPEMKLPTIQELSGSLNVAKATVDTALDALEAEGVIRRRRGSGIYVTPRINQKSIGLVFGHNIFDVSVSPFYALLMRRCRERAGKEGERFSFFIDPLPGDVKADGLPVHHDLAEAIGSNKLHGILLVARNSEEEESWLRARNIPVVGLGYEDGAPPRVAIDQDEFTRLGVQALYESGCRKMGMIVPFSGDSLVGSKMIRVFEAEIRQRGMAGRAEWVWALPSCPHPDVETPQERGRIAFQEILGAQSVPDGLIIGDDMYTRGALAAADNMGVHVGRDLKIATHANKGSPVLTRFESALMRVEVDPDEIVSAMFGMLESLMESRTVSRTTIMVQPRLVVGETK